MFSLKKLTLTKEGRECFYTLSIPGRNLIFYFYFLLYFIKKKILKFIFYLLKGNHPRVWKQFLQLSAYYINNVRVMLETFTHQSKSLQFKQLINKNNQKNMVDSFNSSLFTEKSANVRNLLENKQEFFLPPSLNPRTYSKFFNILNILLS